MKAYSRRLMRVRNINVDFINSNDMGYNIYAVGVIGDGVNIKLTNEEFRDLKLREDDIIVNTLYEDGCAVKFECSRCAYGKLAFFLGA